MATGSELVLGWVDSNNLGSLCQLPTLETPTRGQSRGSDSQTTEKLNKQKTGDKQSRSNFPLTCKTHSVCTEFRDSNAMLKSQINTHKYNILLANMYILTKSITFSQLTHFCRNILSARTFSTNLFALFGLN